MNTETDDSTAVLRARYGARYRWLLLLSVMLGTMASIMSSTIINVAIPDMSQHFSLGQERAQWATSGFMAAMTVSMLTTPWLLARYGYRHTYVGCMWLLLAGGVAGGFANDYPLVLAARVAEGLAAGVVQPIPAIIILRAFEPHEQGRASGIFGMGVVLAPAIGPSIGGLLVDAFGWRSIFFMVVPFCLASMWMAQRFVSTSAPGGGAANPQGAALDWRGLLLATVGTLCLLNGLVQLRGDVPALGGALLGVAALVVLGFVVLQRRMLRARRRQPDAGTDPLMNLSLFKDRRFAMGSIVAVIYGTAVIRPDAGVRPPLSATTEVREKLAPTANAPVSPAARLAPPMARISALTSTRSRRLAARPCAMEICSMKVITAISRAGTTSACTVDAGTPSSGASTRLGSPWGMSPTTARPCAGQSSAVVSTMDSSSTSSGAALVVRSATSAGTPRPRRAGLSQRRAAHSRASEPRPTASVSPCTWPSCWTRLRRKLSRPSPATGAPSTCLSWLVAISRPEAVMKPESTGWLRKLAMKPMRSPPMTSSARPTMTASTALAAMKSTLPAAATVPTAASDMMERSAAGPGPSTVLLHISA